MDKLTINLIKAQLQQISDQLLYATNHDSMHWIKLATNVPQDLAPSAAELATIAEPVQTIVTAFNDGKPQPLFVTTYLTPTLSLTGEGVR